MSTRLRLLLLVSSLACLGPTPGDIGGCGAKVTDLDAPRFFRAKQELDCQSCQSCAIASEACVLVCDPEVAAGDAAAPVFAEQCYPLVHDGEVCLRALKAADCDEYRRYMSDVAPEVPTECNFCPAERGRE